MGKSDLLLLTGSDVVLDSSAILAWLQKEPGYERVDGLILDAAVSAANWAEVLQKVAQFGQDPQRVAEGLLALGLVIEPVTAEDAPVIAGLWQDANDLSLGDRCCLALAQRLDRAAVTADERFKAVADKVGVELIRR